MPILAIFPVLLDMLCIIHAHKTGRATWWYFVILGFPVLGATAYLLIEVLPAPDGRKIARRVVKVIDPSAELKARIREVERCGSAANKVALADELITSGQFDEAIALYQGCMVGHGADDPALMFGVAEAYFYKRDAERSLMWLDKVIEKEPWFRSGDAKLMRARALAGGQRFEEALTQYEALLDHFAGEEARCRYVSLLASLGRLDSAERALAEARRRCDLAGRHYTRTNREWLRGAQVDIDAARKSA